MTKEQIKKLVVENTGIDIDNPIRKRPFVEARAIYYKLLKEYTLLSLAEIGDHVKKNHATVIHGIKNLDSWCKSDVTLKNKYLNSKIRLEILKENIKSDNLVLKKEINLADVEKIVDRYLNLKQKASKQTESNKELLEQVNCFFNILKNLTNKYNENERENRSLKRRFLYWKNKFKNNY